MIYIFNNFSKYYTLERVLNEAINDYSVLPMAPWTMNAATAVTSTDSLVDIFHILSTKVNITISLLPHHLGQMPCYVSAQNLAQPPSPYAASQPNILGNLPFKAKSMHKELESLLNQSFNPQARVNEPNHYFSNPFLQYVQRTLAGMKNGSRLNTNQTVKIILEMIKSLPWGHRSCSVTFLLPVGSKEAFFCCNGASEQGVQALVAIDRFGPQSQLDEACHHITEHGAHGLAFYEGDDRLPVFGTTIPVGTLSAPLFIAKMDPAPLNNLKNFVHAAVSIAALYNHKPPPDFPKNWRVHPVFALPYSETPCDYEFLSKCVVREAARISSLFGVPVPQQPTCLFDTELELEITGPDFSKHDKMESSEAKNKFAQKNSSFAPKKRKMHGLSQRSTSALKSPMDKLDHFIKLHSQWVMGGHIGKASDCVHGAMICLNVAPKDWDTLRARLWTYRHSLGSVLINTGDTR